MKNKFKIQTYVWHIIFLILFGVCSDIPVRSQTKFDVQQWTGAWGSDGPINTGDLNGDGKTDIFIWRKSDNSWTVNLSAIN